MYLHLLYKILALLAKKRLQKQAIIVIGVTGSVGKTTTVSAIKHVLKHKIRVHGPEKNFNNEIGVPLTILQESLPTHKLLWPIKLLRCLVKSYRKPDYQVLILELASDKPGDIAHLCSMVRLDFVIITTILDEVHRQFFPTFESLKQEKGSIIHARKRPFSPIILNADCLATWSLAKQYSAVTITFGQNHAASLHITDIKHLANRTLATLNYKNQVLSLEIPLIGEHSLYCVAPALIIADQLNLPLEDAISALASFQSPPRRLTILPGIQHTTIIDSTYNSSPTSCEAMLKALHNFQHPSEQNMRRIAVLGDMLELGSQEDIYHQKIAKLAHTLADLVILVGPRFEKYTSSLELPHTHYLNLNTDVYEFLQPRLHTGDIILFKASFAIRLEKTLLQFVAEHHHKKTKTKYFKSKTHA